ncbi:MAG: TolC family protein [Polyangiaceae bacterium]|nr:TolC family protein [Polyangiaceae bacterium]
MRNHSLLSLETLIRIALTSMALSLAWAALCSPATAAPKKTTRIGVIVDGKSEYYQRLGESFQREAVALTSNEFDVQVNPENVIECDFTKKCVDDAIRRLLNDPQVDIIVAHGFIASNELAHRKTLKKPALAPFLIDPRAQGLDPERVPRNLAYILWPTNIGRGIKELSSLVSFKKAALLVEKETWAALPPELSPHIVASGAALGKDLQVIPISNQAKEALAALPQDIDAVYVGPLLSMPEEELKALAKGLEAKKLPSFAWRGEDAVRQGFLAGISSDDDFKKLARRFALALQSLLLGERPNTIHPRSTRSERLYLNGTTAAAIGISPNIQTLLAVQVINPISYAKPQLEESQQLSLKAAVAIALQSNLNLSAAAQGVLAAGEAARKARSPLLPQAKLEAGIRQIDRDRVAPASPQTLANWTASGSQLLYSERAWGTFQSAKHNSRAQQEAREGVRLNTVEDVTVAFLSLLQAQTLRQVQESDLKLSRENLEMARIRYQVGQAGREEVFRWESRIAQSRNELLKAVAREGNSRVQLNVIMNRPATLAVQPEDITLETPGLLSSDPRFRGYLSSPRHFIILQEFMVTVGLSNSPEVRRLESEMAGLKRTADAERRSYFIPDVGISGFVNHRFYQGGAEFVFPGQTIDDFDWQAGVQASLPFFEGGLKDATIDQNMAQYGQLSLQKQSTARQVEQNVRVSLNEAGASYAAITITREAKAASEGNLKIVQDQYQRGRATIIQLLDAQNQAIIAENEAANAVFKFLTDLMRVERASGRFGFLSEPQEVESLYRQLGQLAARRNVGPVPLVEAPDVKPLESLDDSLKAP